MYQGTGRGRLAGIPESGWVGVPEGEGQVYRGGGGYTREEEAFIQEYKRAGVGAGIPEGGEGGLVCIRYECY